MSYSVYDPSGTMREFAELEQFSTFMRTRDIAVNYGLVVDWSQVVASINRMTNKDARSAVAKILRSSARKYIRQPVQKEVKRRYPGNKKYPKNKGRKSGMLKGVQYGPLYKDVKLSVYKNRRGVNVSLFSPKKGANRWCVLMWLNDGTHERGNKRSTYKYKKETKRKDFIRRNGNEYRGKIAPSDFFQEVAVGGLQQASNFAASEFGRVLVNRFNGQINSYSDR